MRQVILSIMLIAVTSATFASEGQTIGNWGLFEGYNDVNGQKFRTAVNVSVNRPIIKTKENRQYMTFQVICLESGDIVTGLSDLKSQIDYQTLQREDGAKYLWVEIKLDEKEPFAVHAIDRPPFYEFSLSNIDNRKVLGWLKSTSVMYMTVKGQYRQSGVGRFEMDSAAKALDWACELPKE